MSFNSIVSCDDCLITHYHSGSNDSMFLSECHKESTFFNYKSYKERNSQKHIVKGWSLGNELCGYLIVESKKKYWRYYMSFRGEVNGFVIGLEISYRKQPNSMFELPENIKKIVQEIELGEIVYEGAKFNK